MFQYSATSSAQERRLPFHFTPPHRTAMTELLEIKARILDVRNIYGEELPLITLTTTAKDTIANLKTKFYLKTKTKHDEGEQLYFGIQQLEDGYTLSDYNIQHGYTMVAVSSEGGPPMDDGLFFCMESEPGMNAVMDVLQDLSTSSVEALKNNIGIMIEKDTSWGDWACYGLNKLHFNCNGVEMEDGYTLSDYNIQYGHVIVCKP